MDYYINPFKIMGFEVFVLREECSSKTEFVLYVGKKFSSLDVKDGRDFSANGKWNRHNLESEAREWLVNNIKGLG